MPVLGGCGSLSPTSPSQVSITVTGAGVSTYTYTADVAPILNADCTACHNGVPITYDWVVNSRAAQ